jgi:hypothetical protein
MGGLENSPTPAPVSGLQDDPSESTLISERFQLLRQDVRELKGLVGQEIRELNERMSRYEASHRDLLEAIRIGNSKAEEQIGFLKRKEEREIAAQEASKDAKVKEIEHKQKLEEARWKWWSTDFSKFVLFPVATAIVGAIGAAVGYFFRGVP